MYQISHCEFCPFLSVVGVGEHTLNFLFLVSKLIEYQGLVDCFVLFFTEKNYVQARYHFLHSTDGKGCATMLIEYHLMKGYASEVDLFIAQAVFQ